MKQHETVSGLSQAALEIEFGTVQFCMFCEGQKWNCILQVSISSVLGCLRTAGGKEGLHELAHIPDVTLWYAVWGVRTL